MTDPAAHANPTDTPLTAVLAQLAEQGYRGQFKVLPGGRVECLSCHGSDEAWRYRADEVTRLEGASDPDDMVMVAPLCCRDCDTPGTLVLSYGPESAPEDADVLLALERSPHEATARSEIAGATPGIG